MQDQLLVYHNEGYFQQEQSAVTRQEIQKIPNRFIGLVTMKKKVNIDDQLFANTIIGTGTLISPNVVLTVAHNIYNRLLREDNTDLRFYLGQHGELDRDTYYSVQTYYYDPRFRDENRPDYDIALLKLSKMTHEKRFLPLEEDIQQVKESDKVGLFGYIGRNVGSYYCKRIEGKIGQFQSLRFQYPDSKNKEYAYQEGIISGGSDILKLEWGTARILHKIPTVTGQAGTSIFLVRNNEYSIIGVHKGKFADKDDKVGVAFTSSIISNLKGYIEKMKAFPFQIKGGSQKAKGEKNLTMAENYFKTAGSQLQKKNWEKAVNLYSLYIDVLEPYVVHYWANYNLALALAKWGQTSYTTNDKERKLQQALTISNQLIDIFTDNAQVLTLKGFVLTLLGDLGDRSKYQQSIICFQRANELQPKNPETLLKISSVLLTLDKLEDGIKWILEAQKYRPRTDELCNQKGLYFLKQGQQRKRQSKEAHPLFEKAKEFLRQALTYDPSNEQARTNLGTALQEDGQYAEAIDQYKSVLKTNLLADPKVYNNIAVCYSLFGKQSEANENRLISMSLNPGSQGSQRSFFKNEKNKQLQDKKMVQSIFLQGCSFYEQKRFEQAFEIFEIVTALDPNHIQAHVRKDWTLNQLTKERDEEIKIRSSFEERKQQFINILGKDHLDPSHPPVQISHTKIRQLPHALIGCIIMDTSEKQIGVGSGILISPDLVLTVAHNVFSFKRKKLYTNIRFFPSQNGPLKQPYSVQFVYFPEEFTITNKPSDDYAILKLAQKTNFTQFIELKTDFRKIEKEQRMAIFGYIGRQFLSLNIQDMHNYKIHQWGLIRGQDSIEEIFRSRGEIRYNISTSKGMSGGPLILIDNSGHMSIVGIHKGGIQNNKGRATGDYNVGRLLNRDMIDQLKIYVDKWKAVPFHLGEEIDKSNIFDYKDPASLFEKAEQLIKKEKYEEIQKCLEQILKIDENNLKAYCWLAQALLKQKKYQQALEISERAIQLNKDEPLGHSFKGWALNGLNRSEQALLSCETAVNLDPKEINANNNIAAAYIGLKKFKEALEQCQRMISRDHITFNNIGVSLFSLGRIDEARKQYLKAIKQNPKFATAYNNLSQVARKQGNLQEAQLYLYRSIELDPYTSAYYETLISRIFSYSDQREALGFLYKIMEEHPACKTVSEAYRTLMDRTW